MMVASPTVKDEPELVLLLPNEKDADSFNRGFNTKIYQANPNEVFEEGNIVLFHPKLRV